MNIPEYIILAANSGRMLAQAAKKSGLKPLVIDLCADTDLQQHAYDFRQIQSLSIDHLAPALDYFIDRYQAAAVIYGSGFEFHPESLYYLQTRLNILGNDPDVFIKLQNKRTFFSVLNEGQVLYPEVRFIAPDITERWLEKPMRSLGGLGIKHYRHSGKDGPLVYWQKYRPGRQYSVLFSATGSSIQVIGFNTQWTTAISETETFVFSGVMNATELGYQQKKQVIEYLQKLAVLFQLKGVNSLDFIHSDNLSYVLEINPRPSASLQLYEGDWLLAHIKASQGLPSADLPVQTGFKGLRIVYADQTVFIPGDFDWPEGCMDLPDPGSIISAGQPICSIIAHQNDTQAVLKQLSNTQHFITHKLNRFQAHAI